MTTFRVCNVLITCALCASCPLAARAAACDGSLSSVASTTLAKTNACVAKRGSVLLETAYYQNASKVGGSALAAYPDARVRMGVASNVEAFVDAPTAIAQSGLYGRGIYRTEPAGYGVKVQLARSAGIVYSAQAEVRPPLDVMAPTDLRPMANVALTSGWTSRSGVAVNVQIGALRYKEGQLPVSATTETLAASVSTPLSRDTALTTQLQTYTNPAVGASAQTLGTLGISHQINSSVLMDVEIGTAFNPIGQTKAHYLGAGFTVPLTP